jgi:hypothetical protein
MPPIRERSKSQRVRDNEETAAILATPKATPRAQGPRSRARAATRTPSGRLDTQDLLNRPRPFQRTPKTRGGLQTPESRVQSTQRLEESVPPPPAPCQSSRHSLALSSCLSIEMAEMQQESHQSIENMLNVDEIDDDL